MGWVPTGFLLASPSLCPPSPGWDMQHPHNLQSPMAWLGGLPSLVTPRWLSILMAPHREVALGIHIDIKKGPFVPIN